MKVNIGLFAAAIGMFAMMLGLVAGEPELRGAAITGNVKKPGMIEVQNPTTIDKAFEICGGWGGGDKFPPTYCFLKLAGTEKDVEVPIHVDKKTFAITVTAERWKVYELKVGDIVGMPNALW